VKSSISSSSVSALALISLVGCGGDDGGGPDAGPTGVPIQLRTHVNGAQADLVWVAAQAGDGAVVQLAGSGGSYDFAASDRFALYWVCESRPGLHELNALYATVAELTSHVVRCTSGAPARRTLSGALDSNGADFANIKILFSELEDGIAGAETSYSIEGDVRDGTYDVVGHTTYASPDPADWADRIIIKRGVAFTSANTVVDMDFAAEGQPLPLHVEPHPLASDPITFDFITSGGTHMQMRVDETVAGTLSWTYVPASLMTGTDIMVATQFNTATQLQRRRYFKAPATDLTLTPPPALEAPTVTAVDGASSTRLRFDFTPPPGDVALYVFSNEAASGTITAEVTPGWLGAATRYEVPDLSATSGWMDVYGINLGTSTAWYMRAHYSDIPLDVLVQGDVVPSASWDGRFWNTSLQAGNYP